MTQQRATGNYEVDRQRHLQALSAQLPGEVEKVTWPLDRLHTLRDKRLRALVRTAKQHSPWHAARLRHVDPDTLRGDDLSMIPPMTKADLMANWDDIVTDRRLTLALANAHLERMAVEGPAYLLDDYHVIASGGSSGLRGVFVWDFQGWLLDQLVVSRLERWLLQHLPSLAMPRVATVLADSPIHKSLSQRMTFRVPNGPEQSYPATVPLPEIVAGLNAFQPQAIASFPSALHRLALEAQEGRLRIQPQFLLTGSEPLTVEARRTIEAVFGVPIVDIYGTSETGYSAISYPGSSALHLVEDVAVFEPVDSHGAPVPIGATSSKLLVTNVVNQVLPLIRYELADEMTILDEPNPDPWTGRRIAGVQGRNIKPFVYNGNIVVHFLSFATPLGRLAGLPGYQVRQTPRGVDILLETSGTLDLEPVRQDIVSNLIQQGLPDPEVTLTFVDHIERVPGTGKLRSYIPCAMEDGDA